MTQGNWDAAAGASIKMENLVNAILLSWNITKIYNNDAG